MFKEFGPSRGTHMTVTSARPTRRTLVRGAAWSVPVVSLAAAAPAFAASPITCPIVPPSDLWTTTTTGTLGTFSSGGFAWENGSWIVYRDNGSTADPLTFTSTSPAMTVVPGATYEVSFPFWWGYGNGNVNSSTAGTFDVLFNGASQKSLTTRTPAVDANAAAAGSQPGSTTQNFSYVVPAGTTSVTIVYRYVLTPRSRSASDDIVVGRLSFNNCTAN